MVARKISVYTAIFLITWSTVLQECNSQDTVVDGPTDTVYVNPGVSASFNCTVTWSTSGRPTIFWGRSRDDGATWTNIAQCYDDGYCTFIGGAENEYSVETTQPYTFFKLIVTSPSLSEDGHYDCWQGENPAPEAPHARLYVLSLVTSVTITGYSNGQTETVTAGDPETFECVALAGNPPADLIWTIGNNDITNASEIRDISETGTDTRLYDTTGALLYRFNASDDQKYLKCQSFQHDSLTQVAWQILMDVLHAPVIQAIVADSWEGNTVVVECLATANPDDITYIWESGDQTGDTGNSNKWTLIDEDGDDEVTVTCNASNNEGETSLTEVVKKPYVPTVMTTTDNPYTANEAAVVGTSGCDTGCIIGISVGCSVVVLLVVILVLWWWLRRRNDDKEDDYTKAASSNHRPNTRDAPADVEMTTASGMTTAAPPSDDVDSSKYSDRGYDDRYDDRYANNPRHRYDEPPEDYRYNEPPIDEGDGYPNYSNPSSPNYDSYDRRQQSPQLHYADLDLNPQGQNYQPPPREHTEYTTITPTIV